MITYEVYNDFEFIAKTGNSIKIISKVIILQEFVSRNN